MSTITNDPIPMQPTQQFPDTKPSAPAPANSPTAAAPTPADTGISVQDLQNLLVIIDVASQRGAFRAPELTQIGTLFDKINAFLQAVLPPQDQQAANDTAVQQATTQMSGTPQPITPMAPPFAPKVKI